MNSPEFVQSKLANYTNALKTEVLVDNNRYKYRLTFDEDIGWEWLYTQVRKVSASMDVDVELWKIRPAPAAYLHVDVREIQRRPNIDDNQNSLHDYEK